MKQQPDKVLEQAVEQQPLIAVSEYKPPQLNADFVDLASDVMHTMQRCLSENTQRAYEVSWRMFSEWCARHRPQLVPLPAEAGTVTLYLQSRFNEGLKPTSIERFLAAINFYHRESNLHEPGNDVRVKRFMMGMATNKAIRPSKKKDPAVAAQVKRMAAACAWDILGLRNRAILLLGFAGAFRRSELVDIDIAHVKFIEDRGVDIWIPKSKTNRRGEQIETKHIPFGSEHELCPVRVLKAWIRHANIDEGPLFRSVINGRVTPRPLTGGCVATVVQMMAQAIGLEGDFAAHSLRRGFITSAVQAGKSEKRIMDHTGHKSLLVMRGYIAEANAYRDNAAAGLL